MARRSAFGRINRVLGLIGLLAVVVTYAIVTGWNPLPGWANWLQNATVRKLATPGTAWVVRAGNEPTSATVLSQAIIVSTEGTVEAREPFTGTKLWSQADSWAGVAGGASPVVVVGRPVGSGFDVYDPTSGVKLWPSNGKAGVWLYSDMILTLTCPSGSRCVLRSLDPVNGKPHWSLSLDGAGRTITGFEPSMATVVPVSSAYAKVARAVPAPAPAQIALSIGGDIHVIGTKHGTAMHVFTPSREQRIVVAGNDVVIATAQLRGGQCFYTESGNNPATGAVIWQRTGVNLRTSSGLGCDQRHDPAGAGDVLLGTDTAGRDVVISASTGKQLFRAAPGEHVIAMDGSTAVTRTDDGKLMRGIALATGKQQWTQPTDRDASVGLVDKLVLVADPDGPGHLYAYGPASGQPVLDVVSGSTVLGVGTNTVVVNIGRSIGPLSVGSAS